MNDHDWAPIEQLLAETFPTTFDQRKSDAYRLVLDSFAPADVALGLRRIIERGGTYRPSIAELVAAINPPDAGIPTWDEAYQLIYGPRGAVRERDERAAIERAAAGHEVVGLFVRAQGLSRLRTLPINDPDWGHVERQKLGDAYAQFVDRYHERRREGRVLEALGRGSSELRQLDPLVALRGPRLLESRSLAATETRGDDA